MKTISNENKRIIRSGLDKVLANIHENIARYYLDNDLREVFSQDNRTMSAVNDLQSIFSDDSQLHILTEKEVLKVKSALRIFEILLSDSISDSSEYLASMNALKNIFDIND